MWGTFLVWDARLTSVLILSFIYLGALHFQEFSLDAISIFICIRLINIPIIKFYRNWWNTCVNLQAYLDNLVLQYIFLCPFQSC